MHSPLFHSSRKGRSGIGNNPWTCRYCDRIPASSGRGARKQICDEPECRRAQKREENRRYRERKKAGPRTPAKAVARAARRETREDSGSSAIAEMDRVLTGMMTGSGVSAEDQRRALAAIDTADFDRRWTDEQVRAGRMSREEAARYVESNQRRRRTREGNR